MYRYVYGIMTSSFCLTNLLFRNYSSLGSVVIVVLGLINNFVMP